MSSFCKASILGRLGADPEMKQTGTGKAVCNFRVAASRKAAGGQETTIWMTVVAWEKTAELCARYLAKGSQVYVDGELQAREWTDRDGGKRIAYEIVARDVRFVGSPKGQRDADATAEAEAMDVPF